METNQISLMLGIFSAIIGALTNILAKRVMNFSRTKDFLSLNFLLIFLILAIFSPLYFEFKCTALSITIILIVSLVDAVGNYLYFKSFEVCDTITASSILALSPVFTLILSLLLQGTYSLRINQTLAVCLTISGVVLLSRQIQASPTSHNLPWKQGNIFKILLPLGSAFIFGTTIFPVKYLFSQELTNPATFYMLRAAVIAITTFFLVRPSFSWLNQQTFTFITGRAALVLVQFLLLYYALNAGNPAVVKVASDSSPLFVIFLSAIFFQESITRTKILGSVLVISGLILMSVY